MFKERISIFLRVIQYYISFGQVHTRLLTHKWHELLVLTTSAYQAIHGAHKLGSTSSDGTEADFTQEVRWEVG